MVPGKLLCEDPAAVEEVAVVWRVVCVSSSSLAVALGAGVVPDVEDGRFALVVVDTAWLSSAAESWLLSSSDIELSVASKLASFEELLGLAVVLNGDRLLPKEISIRVEACASLLFTTLVTVSRSSLEIPSFSPLLSSRSFVKPTARPTDKHTARTTKASSTKTKVRFGRPHRRARVDAPGSECSGAFSPVHVELD